jgi:hypothetical protein
MYRKQQPQIRTLFTGSADAGRALRRLLALTGPVAGVLLFALTTADATVDTRPPIAAMLAKPLVDPRSAHLEVFFERYRCPSPLYVSDYLRIADEYDLDYRLLPAISIRETQCGVHGKGNNWLGFHPDAVTFPTPLAGIEFVGHRIAEHPYYRGKTLYQKLFMYNPYRTYPDEVQWLMRQIEP